MRLVVSIATRGRPERLIETMRRSAPNFVLPNTCFMIQIDADDAETIAVIPEVEEIDKRILIDVREREDNLGAKWNRAVEIPADVYTIVGDDDPFCTSECDARILEAGQRFPDGIGMVYGHMANASFSGIVSPTAKFCEKMGGRIFVDYFPYWFVDHWTDDIARIIGRISFADVRTDQSRPGKTQEMREPGWWATFFDAAYLMRRKIAHEIIDGEDFIEPLWRKEILKTHHPLIEFRSHWVNDHVRQQARTLEMWSGLKTGDERYKRVKDRAVAMVPSLLSDYGMDAEEAARYRVALTPPTVVPGLRRAFTG